MLHKKFLTYLGAQSRISLTISSVALIGGLGVLDYLTGYELNVAIFYVFPIALSTWYVHRHTGIFMSLAGTGTWLISDILAGHPYTHPALLYWDATVGLGFFLLITATVAALRASQERQEALIADLHSTVATVKRLEGILPICSFCKKIRDQDKQWQPLEHYIGNHSEAQFSHTFCPSCGQEHYPDYLSVYTPE